VPPTVEWDEAKAKDLLRSNWSKHARHTAILLGVSVSYFVCAKAGLLLASVDPSATPIWPPTGLALSAVLLLGYRVTPAILLGAFLANATTAGSVATSGAIAIGNTLECLVGAWLINRWSGGTATFNTSGGVARFALISTSAATPISALIGVSTLILAGYVDPARIPEVWMTWWLGDTAGALVVTPVITLWAAPAEPVFATTRDWVATVVAYAIAGAVGLITFSPLVTQTGTARPLAFLAILPLAWTALRGNQRDTATVSVLLSGFAVWGTLRGGGPFADTELNDSFLLLVMFMISMSVPSLALSADVAMRKRVEAKLQRARAALDQQVREQATALAAARQELNQAQKMEALGQLTGGVAHDFNNLLTAVLGSLELALRQVTDARVQRLLTTATHAAERGAQLTAKMLAFARRREVATKAVDTNALITGMQELLHRMIGPLIRISLDLEAGLRPAVADPAQLEMALLNLAVNARDAMPLGGDLVIQTRQVSDQPPGRVPDLAPGDYVVVSVGDTGSGMPDDIVAKAFDPFFTTKGPGKGSGLGLSMVYGFARQIGGAATIESMVGKGTTVHLWLRPAVALPEMAQIATVGMRSVEKRRILVVDDDDTVRALAKEMLEEMGHEVIEAASGRSALEFLKEGSQCDLLLVDFAMPLMNGSECATEARKVCPGISILFMTGYADNDALKRWSELGVHTLDKPFQYADLAEAVDRASGSSAGASNVVQLRAP
jgi:signal transduction histidine kinase/ActR/RegA family two-component response regulator